MISLWLMMAKFKVGEIAVIVDSVFHEFIGAECVILGPAENWDDADYIVGINADTSKYNDGQWVTSEKNLRKKKPPEELSTWEEVQAITNWNPKKVNHNV